MKNTFKTLSFITLIAVITVMTAASCATTSARVRVPLGGLTSVIPGGTVPVNISGEGVSTIVSSTQDGSGAVAPGTTVSGSRLTVDANETAQNLYVIATAADGSRDTLAIRVVTVTEVVITPGEATVEAGKSISFTVQVNGNNRPDQHVSWGVGTSPDGSGTARGVGLLFGVLSVPADASGPLYVKATSSVDLSKSAVVRVDVTRPAPAAAAPAPAPATPAPAATTPTTPSTTQPSQPAQQQPAQPAPAGNTDQALNGLWILASSTYPSNAPAIGATGFRFNNGILHMVTNGIDSSWNGTYTTSGNNLVIVMGSSTVRSRYSISGNTLTITEESGVNTYTKQ